MPILFNFNIAFCFVSMYIVIMFYNYSCYATCNVNRFSQITTFVESSTNNVLINVVLEKRVRNKKIKIVPYTQFISLQSNRNMPFLYFFRSLKNVPLIFIVGTLLRNIQNRDRWNYSAQVDLLFGFLCLGIPFPVINLLIKKGQ